MGGITYIEMFIGWIFASGLMWALIFGFAYSRRPFGGSARNYALAFAASWFATVASFVLMTDW